MAMSEEQRKAFGEKMKAARAAKRNQKPIKEEVKETISLDDYNELKKQIEELKNTFKTRKETNTAQVVGSKLLGRTDKFSIDPNNYPDMTDRLKKEPKLQRFAFDINYDLKYEFSTASYQTIDGLNMREPKFTVELSKIVMDEKTGEPTNGRYIINRLIMFEDADGALITARNSGLDIDEMDEVDFLNEVRYIRMRNWLFELFYPSVNIETVKDTRQVVIDGKLVEFYEVSSTQKQNPFEK